MRLPTTATLTPQPSIAGQPASAGRECPIVAKFKIEPLTPYPSPSSSPRESAGRALTFQPLRFLRLPRVDNVGESRVLKVASTIPPERDRILGAALQRMARTGLRHTSMEDVAKEAGLSRAALRLHFKNKEGLVRALLQRLNEQAIAAAESAARSDAPFATRLASVITAKAEVFLVMARSIPCANELLAEERRIAEDIASPCRERHLAILRRVLQAAAREEGLAFADQGTTAREVAKRLLNFASRSGPIATSPRAPSRRRLRTLTQNVVSGLRQNSASTRTQPPRGQTRE